MPSTRAWISPRQTGPVGNRGFFAVEGVETAGRAQGVGQLPADVGDLGNRQEGGHGEECHQRQHRRRHIAGRHQVRAAHDDGEPAEAGGHLDSRHVEREVAEEREAHPVVGAYP